MCGITGIMNFNKNFEDKNTIKGMTDIISHRGPDDEGYLFVTKEGFIIAGGEDTPKEAYVSGLVYAPKRKLKEVNLSHFKIALGHRRLSIIDLSPAGHQPMCNEDGSTWIVYNGEIYNYKEIRKELLSKGYSFQSSSDTEVIIKAYEEWGPDCLNRFNGMWAFCIWDSKKEKFFCARDRFGIKPFYYYTDGKIFAFASEIKSLLQLNIHREPNEPLIYDFLMFGILDHTNETFFKNIQKLPQSHYLEIDLKGNFVLQRYWDLEISNEINNGRSTHEYAEKFKETLTESVRLRLRSDVPIGSCLSGGLDSSSIVCIANELMFLGSKSSAFENQKTFSSCFEDLRFDEREYIKDVIKKTNAEENYVFPAPQDFLTELDELLWHQEEPFAGSSIYAQWLVMKRVKERGVKVILDGQGADEQLGGYRKFYVFYLMDLLKRKQLWRAFSELRFFFSTDILRTLNIKKGLRYFKIGSKISRIDRLLREDFKKEFAFRKPSFGYHGNLGLRIKEDLSKFSLPVLLRYEDKNSMAHSVEARLPFLDYELVERLASFPLGQKMNSGWTKYVLRNAMVGILPDKVRLRKSKLGFVVPEDSWFRDSLKEQIKFQDSVFISRYVDSKKLAEIFDEYLHGNIFYTSELFFRFFILELWGKRFFLQEESN